MEKLHRYAPPFAPDPYNKNEHSLLAPFFTNIDQSVYVPFIFSPEIIGALCSRTSRAKDDLRKIFLNEFLHPFLKPIKTLEDTKISWQEKKSIAHGLKEFVKFLQKNPIQKLFYNPKARNFYIKWLAQYGDDSIAQMAGAHIVFSGISQVAIKHCEDQRIGLAPIEKSSRYVDYTELMPYGFRYYTPPEIQERGLATDYKKTLDTLFATYQTLIPRLTHQLTQEFSTEAPATIRTKVFDTLRGLLPMATLSQVAFFGNGQSFEYMINRSARHPLGEIRWVAQRTKDELSHIIPAFLRRTEKEETKAYQEYLATPPPSLDFLRPQKKSTLHQTTRNDFFVTLLDFDPEGENKVIAGLLYESSKCSWYENYQKIRRLSRKQKLQILASVFKTRTARWYKVKRAFEYAFVQFEITMDIGSWRDLHRHRMQTQQRQLFSCDLGYIVPSEIKNYGLTRDYSNALNQLERFNKKITINNPLLAQYAVSLAHRVRFIQKQNLRAFFWEAELRSIPEGHPHYRFIEQEKFRLLKKVYPLITRFSLVNMKDYMFARRGQDSKIAQKELNLSSPPLA